MNKIFTYLLALEILISCSNGGVTLQNMQNKEINLQNKEINLTASLPKNKQKSSIDNIKKCKSITPVLLVCILFSFIFEYSTNTNQYVLYNYIENPKQNISDHLLYNLSNSQDTIINTIQNSAHINHNPDYVDKCNVNILKNDHMISNQTTLIIMAYKNNPSLMQLIKIYQRYCKQIYEIVLVWNSPEVDFSFGMLNNTKVKIGDKTTKQIFLTNKCLKIVPLIIYQQESNNILNRWLIANYHKFSTKSAVFIDDDIYYNQYAIDSLLKTWQKYPCKIIGPSRAARYLTRNKYTINKDHFNFFIPRTIWPTYFLKPMADNIYKFDLHHLGLCSSTSDDLLSWAALSAGMQHKYLFEIKKLKFKPIPDDIRQTKPISGSVKGWWPHRSKCVGEITNRIIGNQTLINLFGDYFRQNNSLDCYECKWCDEKACS